MKCINPFRFKNPHYPEYSDLRIITCGCGKCFPCLVNRRRQWFFRLLSESFHSYNTFFVTLTYDDLHIPSDGYVVKSHLRKFFKDLRNSGLNIKYYAIGEYGTTTYRPHYHAIIFQKLPFSFPVDPCKFIASHWKYGFSSVSPAKPSSLNYVLHYHVRPKNPIPTDPNCETFFCCSKKLGLQWMLDSDGTPKKFVVDMFKSSSRIVGDSLGNTTVLPRYYVKKFKELGYEVYEDYTNVDYSPQALHCNKIVQNMFPELQLKFDEFGIPINFDFDLYISLLDDILRLSNDKLKKYNYQSKNSI